MKKIISIILAALMLNISAFAAESEREVQIGDYIEMGEYWAEPIVWRCIDIDENGPLFLSDRILCIKPFDAKPSKETKTNSHRHSSDNGTGSNYWADSNIRSWLNSTAKEGKVEWLCGNPPDAKHVQRGYNEYDEEAGFMRSFTQTEIKLIKEVTQKTLLSPYDLENKTSGGELFVPKDNIDEVLSNYDRAYGMETTDRMFLLDEKQLDAINKNKDILGNVYYVGTTTAAAARKAEHDKWNTTSWFGNYPPVHVLADGSKWPSLLRTPSMNEPKSGTSEKRATRYVADDNKICDDASAMNGFYGIRPAFYLNGNSITYARGEGSKSNPYVIDEADSVERGKIKSGLRGDIEGTPVSTTEPTAAPEQTTKPATEPTVAPTETPQRNRGVLTVHGGEEIGIDINNESVMFTDAKPFIDDSDRTQVPIRAVSELFNCDVQWDDATKTATVKRDNGDTVKITIGNDIMTVNGEKVQMDTAAQIVNARTYIPLRFVAEAFGLTVEWEK